MPKSIVRSALLVLVLSAFLPSPVRAQLRTELVADGFVRPVVIAADPLAPERLIVAEQRGLVWVLEKGVRQPTPMLDVSAEVQNDGSEQGFLGLAVHPSGDRIFVSFSKKRTPDAPIHAVGDTVLRRYRRSADPTVLDPSTATDVLFIPQIGTVHRGGDLHFLTDHLGLTRLFMSVGDSGVLSRADVGAQAPDSLFGKMLRLDVEVADDHPVGYQVPPDNPFVDGQPIAARGEIWAFGYRNPWRFSIDDLGEGRTGAMIVGDVGENSREEIDYEPYQQGGRNYGWFIREGSVATGINGTPAYLPLTNPLVDYGRDIGRSTTGGFVYRGSALPAAYRGRYFLADFFGRVFSLGLAIGPTGEAAVADYIDHTAELGNPIFIPTFGRDLKGELYIATFSGGAGGSARVLKIVPPPDAPPAPPANLSYTSDGSTVGLTWNPAASGGAALGYQVEVGSDTGLSDLLVTETPTTGLIAHNVADGRYFVRVRAYNDHGSSSPSSEIEVRIGCVGPPAAPTGLTATVGSGGYVTVDWDPVAGATSYVLEAGSGPGLSDFVVAATPTRGAGGVVPSGVYYARVRAVSSRCGASEPSEEIVVTVP